MEEVLLHAAATKPNHALTSPNCNGMGSFSFTEAFVRNHRHRCSMRHTLARQKAGRAVNRPQTTAEPHVKERRIEP